MSERRSSADSAELEARLALADELMLPGGTHPYLGARKRAMIVAALRARAEPQASAGSGEEWNPTDEQVRSAAMWYRHDLGLLTVAEAAKVKTEARLWLRSWQKEVAALRAEPQSVAEPSPCAYTGYVPHEGDEQVLVRIWGFGRPDASVKDVRVLYSFPPTTAPDERAIREAFDDWSWTKEAPTLGLMTPAAAARAAFQAGIDWSLALTRSQAESVK
jgi:hypothetical protein